MIRVKFCVCGCGGCGCGGCGGCECECVCGWVGGGKRESKGLLLLYFLNNVWLITSINLPSTVYKKGLKLLPTSKMREALNGFVQKEDTDALSEAIDKSLGLSEVCLNSFITMPVQCTTVTKYCTVISATYYSSISTASNHESTPIDSCDRNMKIELWVSVLCDIINV